MKDLIIVGGGGFAREVEWLIERINKNNPTWNLLGYISKKKDSSKVIGDDGFLVNYDKEIYIVIAIGETRIRKELYFKYKSNPNIKYANLIDPSCHFSNNNLLGEGNIICAGTIMTVDISIGSCNIINLDCTVGHDAIIGDYVTINPSVNISGGVEIGSGCNIGTGTQILQYLKIGDNTVVGAGAVVNHDLPSRCTAVGVPIRVIKSDM